MVGAPNGRYPGGLYPNTDTPLSREACSVLYTQAEIDTFNDSQVIDLCYKNHTGLVYQCSSISWYMFSCTWQWIINKTRWTIV